MLGAFARYGAGAFVFTGALFTANAAFNNLGRPLWSTVFNWSRDAGVIPLLAFLFAGSLGTAGAVWIQAMAGVVVGTTAGIVGWRTVHKIARRGPAPAPTPAPAPAFVSGRAATGLASEAAPPEPLASGDETR